MKVRMVISTGYAGADHVEIVEITEEDLQGETLEEYCQQYLEDMIGNYIDTYYEVIEP